MVHPRPLASLAPPAAPPSRRTRPRRLRLDFDGGPWLAGRPLARTSPWAELAAGALAAAAAGSLVDTPAAIVRLGWAPWALAAPVAALVAAARWIATGTWRWVLPTAALGPLGWAFVGMLAADVVQAVAPLTFPRRVAMSAAAGAAVCGVVTVVARLWT